MRLRVLGCSGGIGGAALRTTAMLLDTDILIDAGTGACELSLTELAAIDHIFLTHSHLDHVAAIPLMLDAVAHERERPLTVHALPATITALQQHIFNWTMWPDFSRIPSAEAPGLVYAPLTVGTTVTLQGRRITPLPANHVVPALGYQLDSGAESLVFSGDTTSNEALWPFVNRIDNLRYLIMECAFHDSERDLAVVAKHLCPSLLTAELQHLQRPVELYITHLKPGEAERTMAEIEAGVGGLRPRMLQHGQILEF